ncbi:MULTISPECIES: serine hydrolase [Staphylococcus]|uniref:serine hydrolase domain-containing protein n=1 Tax=Staphylococcus TaxID=1279 RepID=UPI0001A96140|nr:MULTISPECIES: serine hydrolase domain-containing protein [Staphylococcus]EHM73416.1 beta-lactamase [Staphylococcus epidermidis 14.1.R1.SE]APT16736.1 methicillin resistance protein FmtA [Staphylococcus epidermidis]ASJ93837.1 methicillin resistance protein FmtA [Staphylococcus epidermidis]ATQ59868.1 methicillin resistance protein FmtA [Staphylococcus epidermidis]EES36479.1 beta-lactamase [Staphylococcus epidermidis W23144]
MKLNKFKIVFFIIVLLTLVVSIGILGVEWTRHLELKKQTLSQESGNTNYIEKRDKTAEKPKKLKTKYDKKDPISKSINKYLEKTQFNGTVAVFDNGKVKMNKGYGYQDIEKGKKNTANTMYLIGSAQKFTTGLMLKQLEVENKVNLQDSVTKYIPWFKTNKEITIKDLMLHKSGLYKYEASTNIKNLEQAVRAIQARGIDDTVYHKHQYNDANYLVLAKVIENVTGKPYVKNYYERLGNKYNLKHTAFYDEKPLQSEMAKGYKFKNNTFSFLKPNILDQYYGAGNLYMTPHDMGKLIYTLQQNKIFNARQTRPILHEFGTQEYPEEYRYGFYITPYLNRVNGVFFGQIFTVYFNDRYIVILGTNVSNTPGLVSNENKMRHIFYNILDQKKPYNTAGVKVE